MPPLKQLLALFLLVSGAADALGQAEPPARKFVVATRHVPPFSIKDEEGNWSGIAIDLLSEIIVEQGDDSGQLVELEFRELTLKDMLAAVEQGDVDRENKMDFSHPFHTSGLGIAVVSEKRSGWLNVLERIFSFTFLKVVRIGTIVLRDANATHGKYSAL